MELQITKEAFKSQAKKQHLALKARSIPVKLSDIQESLAVAYGFENLATLYADIKAKASRYVEDLGPFKADKANLFVFTWVSPTDENGNGLCEDDVLSVFPPGTQLSDTYRTHTKAYYEFIETSVKVPDGLDGVSQQTLALESYCVAPRPDRYGLPHLATEVLADRFVKNYLGFRVPKDGMDTNFSDSGDDGSGKDYLLVWVTDDDAKKLRALFA